MQHGQPEKVSQNGRRFAIAVNSAGDGGSERVALRLAKGFSDKGYEIDLLLFHQQGQYYEEISSSISIYILKSKFRLFDIFDWRKSTKLMEKKINVNPLHIHSAKRKIMSQFTLNEISNSQAIRAIAVSRYIQTRRPHMVFSLMHHVNLAAIHGIYLAKIDSGQQFPTPLLVASIRDNMEHSSLKVQNQVKEAYPNADAIVCVSHGLAKSAVCSLHLPEEKIFPIYNPLPYLDILRKSKDNVLHPWFNDSKIPVILTVGRLSPQKDHHTLINAFSLVFKERESRLIIMANDSTKFVHSLAADISNLGLQDKIQILSFDPNPFRYMRRASCFVLSSIHEGLPNVLLEAMTCGTPVVSTDACYGPREILEDGKWGKIVPIRDSEKLAGAILDTLSGRGIRGKKLKERAKFFSTERSIENYLSLINRLNNKKTTIIEN